MEKKHQALLNSHVNYIRKVAYDLTRTFCIQNKSLNNYYVLRDELCSYAFEVMCDKIKEYDEEKGAFYNYTYNVLTPNLKNYYYRQILKNQIENKEYSEMLSEESELSELYEDNSEDNLNLAFEVDVREGYLIKAMETLDEQEQEFLRLIYFEKKSILEASKRLKIKSNYHHHKRILDKMKIKLNYYDRLINNIDLLEEYESLVLREYFFNDRTLEEISEKLDLNDIEDIYKSAIKNLRTLNKIDELPRRQRDILKDLYFKHLNMDCIIKKYNIENVDVELERAHLLLKEKMN